MTKLDDNEIHVFLDKWLKEFRSISQYNFVPLIISNVYCLLAKRGALSYVDRNLLDFARQMMKYMSMYDREALDKDLDNFDDESLKRLVWIIGKGMLDKYNYSLSTSQSVAELVYRLLNIKEDDMVFDLGSDYGQMLTYFYQRTVEDNIPLSGLYGIEKEEDRSKISNLLLAILSDSSEKCSVKNGDALRQEEFSRFDTYNNVYDKAYCFVNANLYNTIKSDSFYSYLYRGVEFNESYQEQWVYIDRLLYGLKDDNSRAIALVAGKSLMQTDKNQFVRSLLGSGYIEAIITLPQGVLSFGGQSYLVVFSKNNREVKIVNADEDKFVRKNENYSSHSPGYGPQEAPYELNVEMVLDLYNSKNDLNCRSIPAKELENFFSCLIPESVFRNYDPMPLKSGETITLSDVAEVLTGTQYTIKQFTTSTEPTGYQILTSSDIHDGTIDYDHLTYIKNDKNLSEKVFVKPNDVIITTKSTKVKVAVVLGTTKNQIVVSGGMIIIRPNRKKLNPLYLQMFLECEDGQKSLQTLQTGTTIMNLSPKMVANLKIPATGIEVQDAKANEYLICQQSIRRLQDQIENLEMEMKYKIY